MIALVCALLMQEAWQLDFAWKEAETEREVRVVLDGDLLRVGWEQTERVYDFARGRIVLLDHEQRRYDDTALVAVVDYREAEMLNRAVLGLQVREAGQVEPGLDVPELEQVFSLTLNLGALPEPLAAALLPLSHVALEEQPTETGAAFARAGELLAEFALGSSPVPPEQRRAWTRLLVYECSLHPQVLGRLVADGRLPDRIWYRFLPFAGRRVEVELRLQGVEATMSGALPADYTLYRRTSERLSALLERAGAASDALDQQGFADLAAAALQRGDRLDAFLAVVECGLQLGATPQELAQQILDQGKDDDRLQSFLRGLRHESMEDVRASLALLSGIDRSTLTRGHVIDCMRANAHAALGEGEESEALFVAALEQNPFLTGAWKDLGTLYHDAFEMEDAWRCWEAALALSPEHPNLEDVLVLRAELRRAHPEFF